RIVPNGVNVERYAPLRALRAQETPHVIGLIGRIVPIKDIKAFIRTIGIVAARLPDIEGWLIGPEEEDQPYVAQCRQLVRTLGLEQQIKFLGFQRIEDVLPRLGLLALTSISEAFPLVIGESYASGLPVVTTDVGACRELVEGADEEDRALGSGGTVVPICDPPATAAAALALLTDGQRWRAAQRAGISRVERYYRQERVLDSYRDLYRELDSAAVTDGPAPSTPPGRS
ncbi:MAG: GT4 family glycosyltransferase PelF, partial [Janthinobacterium lividum]